MWCVFRVPYKQGKNFVYWLLTLATLMNWEIISALTLGLTSFSTSSITQNDVWGKKLRIVVKFAVFNFPDTFKMTPEP